MIELYKHQKHVVKKVMQAWESPWKHKHSTLVVAPTGSGKSVIALSAALEFMLTQQRDMRVLLVAHSLPIIQSLYKDATEKFPFDSVGLIDGKNKQFYHKVTVATVQSLVNPDIMMLLLYMGKIDVLIIDEAHRGVTMTHKKVYESLRKHNPDLRTMGMTATYKRTDDRGLREVFTHCAARIQVRDLVNSGHLAKPKMYRRWWKDIFLTHDDPSQIAAIWQQATKGERKTIIFCKNKDHGRRTFDFFYSLGADVAIVHDEIKDAEREKAVKAHVLINIDVYKEGANIPGVSCVMVAKRASETPWRQMIGRGLRIDTKDCLIICMNKFDIYARVPRIVLGVPKPVIETQQAIRDLSSQWLSWIHG